jgi:hypothetical protein
MYGQLLSSVQNVDSKSVPTDLTFVYIVNKFNTVTGTGTGTYLITYLLPNVWLPVIVFE